MKSIRHLLIVATCFSISTKAAAQVSLETFFKEASNFMAANYTKKDLRKIKQWSDSTYVLSNSKKDTKHQGFKGKLITNEGVNIEFDFLASELTKINEKKSNGSISINHYGDCMGARVCDVLGIISRYPVSFDTINVIQGTMCSCNEVRLHFNNYSPSTNKVLQDIDTSLTVALKHEYFDFYFADINAHTSTWQEEFRTFMQPYSAILIALLKKNDIESVFKLIALKNKGYSWSLAEGLWYYNTLHPCLTTEQMKIVDSYNGKQEMLFFRPAEELKQIYKF